MKRLLIVVAIVALALAAAPVALAGQGQGGKPGPTKAKGKAFVCHGKVVAVDVGGKSVTLRVWSGNKGLRKYRGHDLVVQAPDATKIVWRAFGEATAVGLADVKVGERIWVRGTVDRSNPNTVVYTAQWVRLQATWPFSVQGTVTDLSETDATIVVKVDRAMVAMRPYIGEEVTFQTTSATVFKKWVGGVCTTIAFADVTVGDKVGIGGTVDNTAPPNKQFIAKRVVVKD